MLSERIRSRINNLTYTNAIANRAVWRLFYSEDKRRAQVAISEKAQEHLRAFEQNGIVAIPGFDREAEHIQREYFDVIEENRESDSKHLIVPCDLGERGRKTGNYNFFISFRDPALASIVLNPDLAGIVYDYYRRQPFFRNQPLLAKQHFGEGMERDITNKYHLDGFRQVSYMLLVNDLTLNDIHMQYACGSNRDTHTMRELKDRFSFPDESIEQKYKIFDCIGPKGTLFVFDAGNGFHRGLPQRGSTRKILHFNMTTGHYLTMGKRYDSAENWSELAAAPAHVRQMFDKVLL